MVLVIPGVILGELLFDLEGSRLQADALVPNAADAFAAEIHHPGFMPFALVAVRRQNLAREAWPNRVEFGAGLPAASEQAEHGEAAKSGKSWGHIGESPLRVGSMAALLQARVQL